MLVEPADVESDDDLEAWAAAEEATELMCLLCGLPTRGDSGFQTAPEAGASAWHSRSLVIRRRRWDG